LFNVDFYQTSRVTNLLHDTERLFGSWWSRNWSMYFRHFGKTKRVITIMKRASFQS